MKTVWTAALGISALTVLLGMVPGSSGGAVAAAAPDVRLSTVSCASAPEVIEVKNLGTDAQSLSGWQLQSDGNAPFDLTPAGNIPAGGSIFIEAGPGAQGSFVWSQSEILRDNDPADYARLVDNTGVTEGQIACGQATTAPTPTIPGPGNIPNGGGPPAIPADGVLSPALLVYAGGSVMGAVAGIALAWLGVNFGLGWKRKGRAHVSAPANFSEQFEPAATKRADAAAAAMPVQSGSSSAEPLLLTLVIALVAATFVALLLLAQDPHGRR